MWEMLYEEFWDKLEHFCFRLCRDEGRAEDMTQEVFLRALQNRALIESFTSVSAKPGCLPPPAICTVTRCAGQPGSSSCWRRSARDPSRMLRMRLPPMPWSGWI